MPTQGDFAASLTFGETLNEKHYLPNGDEVDVGHTRAETLAFDAMYGLTDRVTIRAGIPYVRSKYTGGSAHPGHVDDGGHNETFTDLRFSLHFQAFEQPFAWAPYLGVVVPVTDYETLGHAAPGRGLQEAWVGFYAGKNLDPWIPQTYVQLRYNYAFVEKVAGVSHDRSNADIEVGFFVTPEWSVRVLASWQDTYGGLDVPVPRTHPLYAHHDQLASETFLNVGAGAAWSLSQRIDIYAIYLSSVRGTNGHKLDRGLTLGIGYLIPAD